MNKTQKSAWFCLATYLLALAIILYVSIKTLLLKSFPESLLERFWALVVYCIVVVTAIVFMRKKQSLAEVDEDERDKVIKRTAVLVAFVSVWILLFAASLIPQFILGKEGAIPVWLLPIINLAVSLIVGLIYTIAILVQYGWGDKNGK